MRASLASPSAFAVLLLVAHGALSSQTQSTRPLSSRVENTTRWPEGSPEDHGIDAAALQALYSDMSQEPHHDLKGIVILRDGYLVSEHYFNGDSADTLHDIRSATKSITSLLMGIAIQKGLVHSVDDSIGLYLPDLPRDGKQRIAIRDLLNMRSGLDANDEDPSTAGNEDRLDQSSNWIRSVYAVPMKRQPGETYVYCSINAFMTGAIVENASHMPLDRFAAKNLFIPLGITQYRWRHVPVDRITGQGNLEITTRDEAAVGEFILNDGVARKRRILDHGWIAKSVKSQVAISDSDPYADFYGYMWYTKAEPVSDHTVEVHFASGNGGNKIYVIPSLHMVVAITSSAYGRGYGQRRSQDTLLKILSATNPDDHATAHSRSGKS
jgi:CubicO group peptidase (beta-lactamase class C family)